MNIETNIEDQVREAILAELQRQADAPGLTVSTGDEGKVQIQGSFNIDDLALAVTGALAGGP